MPLIEIAHARSGDKGNHSNIGVIARKAEYLPWIRAALTEANVSDYMQHVLDPEKSKVIRYELPAMNALNFMLENALGGGGIASLRIDPCCKACTAIVRYASQSTSEIVRKISKGCKSNGLSINFQSRCI